jgi:hypothetical protein
MAAWLKGCVRRFATSRHLVGYPGLHPKTVRSRRRVPVRARVVDALRSLAHRRRDSLPAPQGGRVDINRSHHRARTLAAAGSRIGASTT